MVGVPMAWVMRVAVTVILVVMIGVLAMAVLTVGTGRRARLR